MRIKKNISKDDKPIPGAQFNTDFGKSHNMLSGLFATRDLRLLVTQAGRALTILITTLRENGQTPFHFVNVSCEQQFLYIVWVAGKLQTSFKFRIVITLKMRVAGFA